MDPFYLWTFVISILLSQNGVLSQLTNFISFPKHSGNERNGTTIVYVHDWNTPSIGETIAVSETLLNSREDVDNVVVADWSAISQSPDFYNLAERLTPRIAIDVLSQIRSVVENEGVEPSKVECVGHGIGAHVCGQVGKKWNQNGRGKLGKIIGLNPTGPYFKEHLSERLDKGDANYVEAWHTDQRLGIYSDIGDNNTFPSGGPEIRACSPRKLLPKNNCLHQAAVLIFLRSLKENVTAATGMPPLEKIPMSILTLDVSPSMQSFARIQNMVTASKRFIHSLPLGYFIGIVIFGGEAHMTLSPTNITNDSSRLSIISRLPTVNTQISNTSIGGGVLKAYEVIQPYLSRSDSEYCPDIILVTDGEENREPFLRDLPLVFENGCTQIHSIALGDEADPGLEALSEFTGGQTYFASDVNSRDKLTQSLVASSTSQFANGHGMPIVLPPKEVKVDVPVSFQFDEGIGRDTTFVVSTPHPEQFDGELTGPNGVTYGVGNYTVDTDLHQLLFKLLEVQAGNWTFKLNPGAGNSPKTKRSATLRKRRGAVGNETVGTIFVTSYPSDEDKEPIRLDATLSRRVLDYSTPGSIAIEATLYRGDDAILGAHVEAEIISSDGSRILAKLLDNGAGADVAKDDGIYTRFITTPLLPGKRYQVDVRATSAKDGATKVRSGTGDPYKVNAEDLSSLSYDFERQANAGSFRVSPTSPSLPNLPPNPVRDLQVVHVDEDTRRCTLTWTAAGKVLDNNETADSIQVQAFTGYSNNNGSAQGFTFAEQHVVGGSLSAEPSGGFQNVTIEIPEELWEESKLMSPDSKPSLYFTVQSFNAEGGWSQASNFAPIEFGFNESSSGWTALHIALVVILSLILIILVGVFIFLRRRMAHFKLQTK